MTPGTKHRSPGLKQADAPRGAIIRRHSGATEVEGKGDVGVEAVAFPEGVEPHYRAAEKKAAATEALRTVIAPPLFASSGVAGTGNSQGMEVVELKHRYRHARTAFAATAQR